MYIYFKEKMECFTVVAAIPYWKVKKYIKKHPNAEFISEMEFVKEMKIMKPDYIHHNQ